MLNSLAPIARWRCRQGWLRSQQIVDARTLLESEARTSVPYFRGGSKPYTRWWWLAGRFRHEDIRSQLAWLHANGFGGVELATVRLEDGTIGHAEIRVGDTVLLAFDRRPDWPALPSLLRIFVADADATFERAVAAGARRTARTCGASCACGSPASYSPTARRR